MNEDIDIEQKATDSQTLTEAGWKLQGSMWVNTRRFVGFNEQGKVQSVPDGVQRPLEEAIKLERMRPKQA